MQIIKNKSYLAILDKLHKDFPYWDRLEGKSLFLSGATGMIGSLLVDVIMFYNENLPPEKRCRLITTARNQSVAELRFAQWMGKNEFAFFTHDICTPVPPQDQKIDYLIHAASTTHPLAYASEPINTILVNVLGTHHMLEIAAKNPDSRFLFLSSVEIYGENRGDTEYFNEDYCGYLDCNTLRAGYPESKRVSEAMCQAYRFQRGVDVVILRLPRTYGPTMRMSDTKAIAQFIQKGVDGEDIVLKSQGNQLYSYAHSADVVLGILWVLLCGETGQAYNLDDNRSDITLIELAKSIANYAGTKVVFDLPDQQEQKGYSTATKALMNGCKLNKLGWTARYEIKGGVCKTIEILRQLKQSN